jgi:non-ribosomal peptide synthetase component F
VTPPATGTRPDTAPDAPSPSAPAVRPGDAVPGAPSDALAALLDRAASGAYDAGGTGTGTGTAATAGDRERAAAGQGTRVAVEWRGQTLTRAALAAAVDALAGELTARGAARTHVLVNGPVCPGYVAGLLAALKAGAVPVPVDAGMSAAQYAWIAAVARPSTVLSTGVSSVAHFRGDPGTPELVLDAATGQTVLSTDPAPGYGPVPRHAAADAGYVIPTSGSTGAPKAVVGSRAGLHAFLTWFTAEFGIGERDTVAAVTRAGFDPSLRELLAVLAAGGRLVLPDVDAQLDFRALAAHLAGSRPTLLFLVPSLARRVAEVLLADGVRLPTVRHAFFAGEVLSAKVLARWAELAPAAEFTNLYGLTEGTLAQLHRRGVRPGDAVSGGAISGDADFSGPGTGSGERGGLPVGRPRPGVTVTIDAPDADGLGEVLIRSAAPALGLLDEGLDEGTGNGGAFAVRPLPAVLRTGDVGRVGADGEVVVVGRIGDDLKVSGRRVSFHTLTERAEELAGVRQCVVVDRQGPHAFLAVPGLVSDAPAGAGSGAEASGDAAGGALTAELREAVHRIARDLGLPRPRVLVRRDLPLLRSGKVDRVALAASIPDDDDRAGHATPATGPDVESQLRALLGLDAGTHPVGEPVDLTDAGLTSLDLMEFALEVNRRWGTDLSAADCFRHRDTATLARIVAERCPGGAPTHPGRQRVDATSDDVGGGTHDEHATYPLSTRQLAYMASCMADGNANWANISREIRVDRELTEADVRAAVGVLVARHDVLRLSLTPEWTAQRHRPAAELDVPVTVHRWAGEGRPDEDAHRARVQRARVEAVAPLIDPEAAPPLRVALVPGDGTASVLLVAHHLFVDGLSLDLLAAELRDALLGEDVGARPVEPAAYRSYCRATRRPDAARTPDADYWDALLAGAGQTELPADHSPEGRQGRLVSRPFGVTGARAAHRIAAAHGVSVFSVVLAAYDLAVSRVFGTGPLTVILPVQVRDGVPARAAGMFMSQLVVRGPGDGELGARAREFARQVTEGTAAGGWEFDQRLASLALPETDAFPLSTVLFNQHPRPRGLRAADLGDTRPRSLGRELRYQLQGELQVSGPEMTLTYYYRQGIAADRPDVIDRLHATLLAALRDAGRTPDA